MQSNMEATSEQLRPKNSNPAAWEDISSTDVKRGVDAHKDKRVDKNNSMNKDKKEKGSNYSSNDAGKKYETDDTRKR